MATLCPRASAAPQMNQDCFEHAARHCQCFVRYSPTMIYNATWIHVGDLHAGVYMHLIMDQAAEDARNRSYDGHSAQPADDFSFVQHSPDRLPMHKRAFAGRVNHSLVS